MLFHEIDLARAEHLGELTRDGPEKLEPRRPPLLELHQHIHIALRTEVIPHHRPEKGQASDAPLPAERGDLLVRDGDGELSGGGHGTILPAAGIEMNASRCYGVASQKRDVYR